MIMSAATSRCFPATMDMQELKPIWLCGLRWFIFQHFFKINSFENLYMKYIIIVLQIPSVTSCAKGLFITCHKPTQPKTHELQQVCCRFVIWQSSSRYLDAFTFACTGWMTTSLLQVVNRFDAS